MESHLQSPFRQFPSQKVAQVSSSVLRQGPKSYLPHLASLRKIISGVATQKHVTVVDEYYKYVLLRPDEESKIGANSL
jgi:hypothetical protein